MEGVRASSRSSGTAALFFLPLGQAVSAVVPEEVKQKLSVDRVDVVVDVVVEDEIEAKKRRGFLKIS